jgi:hypothetical protein
MFGSFLFCQYTPATLGAARETMDSDELYEFFELVLKQLLAAVPNLCQKVKDERYADNLLVSLQRLNTVLAKIHIWLGSSARVGSATTRRMKKMLNDLETMCSVRLCRLHF